MTEQAAEKTQPAAFGLAGMDPAALVDESGMAAAFGVTGRTIRRMVTRGELPPPIRCAGRAVWIAGRVQAWIDAAAEAREAEAREAEARRHLEKIRRLSP